MYTQSMARVYLHSFEVRDKKAFSDEKKKRKRKKIVKSNLHTDDRLRVDRLCLTFPNPILLEHGNERRGGNPASWPVSRVFELNNDRL